MAAAKFKRFICIDCGENTHIIGEYYMLKNSIWHQIIRIKERGKMLCIGCVENRLGKKLCKNDFLPDAPINSISLGYKSSRLLNRLKSIK